MQNSTWGIVSGLFVISGFGAILSPLLARAAPDSAGTRPAFSNEVSITVEAGMRIIRSNGIPRHETGTFPNRGNPNSISPQHYEFRVPAEPKRAVRTTPLGMQPFGVAVNGVVFDPSAAEWWNGERNSGWQYDPLSVGKGYLGVDKSNAHVQPNGAYHYHGLPTALIYALTDGKEKMVLVGWAADGFPIYNPVGYSDPNDARSASKVLKSSYRVKKGTRPDGPGGAYDGTFVADYEYAAGSGDLDECNGLTGVTPEYPRGIYHYILTEQFPFVPRMYRGTPDPSFNTHGPRGGPGAPDGEPGRDGPGRPGGRPPLPLIVRALDADGDGIISAEEIANAVAILKTLDKNGDGQLTPDEYLGPPPEGGPSGPDEGRRDGDRPADDRPGAGPPGRDGGGGPPGPRNGAGRRPPIPRIVRALDLNGDGIISADEIAKAVDSLKTLDKNGDGKLTPEEYLGPRPPRGPRGGPDGERDGGPPPPNGPPPEDGPNPPPLGAEKRAE